MLFDFICIKYAIMKIARFSLIFFPLVTFIPLLKAQTIPFDDKRWSIDAKGFLLEGFKGKNALYLQDGKAWLKNESFLNGIIEFDIYLSQRVSFSGLVFRGADKKNYEELYLRSHQSGYPDAFQYTPVFNGDAGWQLYHDQFDGVNNGLVSWKANGELNGYNAVAFYPFDRWLHVKLLVKGKQAELYFDNNEDPAAFIPELKRGEQPGSIGVESGIGAVYFSNFSYQKTDDIKFKTSQAVLPVKFTTGVITSWKVSNSFKEDELKRNELDEKFIQHFQWQSLAAEKGDFINISKLFSVTDSNTVFANLSLQSDRAQIKKLDLGYSDRIKVYCNGQAIYSGNSSFRAKDFRYLGTIGYCDAVYLPLKKGENEILIAVSETFGGWALMGRLENLEGIKIIEGK